MAYDANTPAMTHPNKTAQRVSLAKTARCWRKLAPSLGWTDAGLLVGELVGDTASKGEGGSGMLRPLHRTPGLDRSLSLPVYLPWDKAKSQPMHNQGLKSSAREYDDQKKRSKHARLTCHSCA